MNDGDGNRDSEGQRGKDGGGVTKRERESEQQRERESVTVTGTGGVALTRERIHGEETRDENRSSETRAPKTRAAHDTREVVVVPRAYGKRCEPRRGGANVRRTVCILSLSAVHRGYTHERRKRSR